MNTAQTIDITRVLLTSLGFPGRTLSDDEVIVIYLTSEDMLTANPYRTARATLADAYRAVKG